MLDLLKPESAILSTAYFPPISYFSIIRNHSDVEIEAQEFYAKQSYRNRCYIATASGKKALIIPVQHAGGKKICIRDVKISYEFDWQKNHWKTIESAYNKSAFFEYYKDQFIDFYYSKIPFLFDYNAQILSLLISFLKLTNSITYTREYIDMYSKDKNDCRFSVQPKSNTIMDDSYLPAKQYGQVFSDRNGFISNLSILDLLFCKGFNSIDYF